MSQRGSFYHPIDRWSTTVAEAEEHARFHAVDDSDPYDGYTEADFEPEKCDSCGEELELSHFVDEETGAIFYECASCGTEYDMDEIPYSMRPEDSHGQEDSIEEEDSQEG